MPKVKKGAARKPAKARGEGLRSFIERYALAGVAGAIVIALVGVMVMWAGGYVGLVGERVDASVRGAVVGAGFEIRQVTLMGRGEATRKEIESALGPALGDSILHFDIEAARRRIENLGWVRSAAVVRLLPDTIHVSLRERAPAAVWQMSGRLHLVDETGALIRTVTADEYADLPLIVGAGAPAAAGSVLKALAARPEIEAKVSSLTRIGDRRWNMRLKSGVDVWLPESDFDAALDVLARLGLSPGALDARLEYLDLRDPERLVARRRGEETPLD